MNERKNDAGLSTADMVSATAQREPQGNGHGEPRPNGGTAGPPPAYMNRDATNRPTATASKGGVPGKETTPLVSEDQAQSYRSHWEEIQTGFVDEPRQAVEQADHLVAEVIKRVAEVFAAERSKLEEQWSRGGEADTEDLRQALKRYRSFFERLLSA